MFVMRWLKSRHYLAFSIIAIYLASFHLPILLACGRWTPKSAGVEMLTEYLQFPEYMIVGTPFVVFANLAIILGIVFLFRGWWIAAATFGGLASCIALMLGSEALSFGSSFNTESGLEVGPGYCLWLACAALLTVGGFVTRARPPTTAFSIRFVLGILSCVIGVCALAWMAWENTFYELRIDRDLATAPDRKMAEMLVAHDFYSGRWMTCGPILLPLLLVLMMMVEIVRQGFRLRHPQFSGAAVPNKELGFTSVRHT
jgi:hypothetical protein